MSVPYGMHIIETKYESSFSLYMQIPSPFEEGKIITANAELHPRPNNQYFCEIWGAIPQHNGDEMELRGKYGCGTLTKPDGEFHTFGAFMDAMLQTLMKMPFYQNAVKAILDAHMEAAFMKDLLASNDT